MKTLKDWRRTIAQEAPRVDKAPYSHNIIGLALGAIAREWGQDEANKAIRDYKLTSKGWSERTTSLER